MKDENEDRNIQEGPEYNDNTQNSLIPRLDSLLATHSSYKQRKKPKSMIGSRLLGRGLKVEAQARFNSPLSKKGTERGKCENSDVDFVLKYKNKTPHH